MRILHRYILRELTAYLLISLFFLTFVLLLHKMLQFTDLVVNRGVPLWIVAQFLLAALPVLLLATLPMSTLIACVMAFSRLSSDSEFVAMTASGMGLYSQIIPVGAVGAAAAAASAFLLMFALPWSQDATVKLSQEILRNPAAAFRVREGVFNNNFDGVMLYVRETAASGSEMAGIMISDARDAEKKRVIFADRGMLLKSPASPRVWLRLVRGTVHTVSQSPSTLDEETGAPDVAAFTSEKDHYQIARFRTYDLSLNPAAAIGKTKALRESLRALPLGELRRKLGEQEPGTSRYNAILVELNKKFALPFACLLLAFLGAPLGVRNRRSGRHGGFALSLGCVILYYMVVTLAEGMGESGQVNPWVAAWGPNILLAIVAGLMVRAVGRGGAIDIPGTLLKPASLLAGKPS